jgi:tRNA threonylcarbamoyladenosine modification (KEOPS) complex Cgi121 subunit
MNEEEAIKILEAACRSQVSVPDEDARRALGFIKLQMRYLAVYDNLATAVEAAVHRYERGMNNAFPNE